MGIFNAAPSVKPKQRLEKAQNEDNEFFGGPAPVIVPKKLLTTLSKAADQYVINLDHRIRAQMVKFLSHRLHDEILVKI
jgi:hypothetical protein